MNLQLYESFQSYNTEISVSFSPNSFRDNSLGEMSHLSYNLTRLEVERPILVCFSVSLFPRVSKPSS